MSLLNTLPPMPLLRPTRQLPSSPVDFPLKIASPPISSEPAVHAKEQNSAFRQHFIEAQWSRCDAELRTPLEALEAALGLMLDQSSTENCRRLHRMASASLDSLRLVLAENMEMHPAPHLPPATRPRTSGTSFVERMMIPIVKVAEVWGLSCHWTTMPSLKTVAAWHGTSARTAVIDLVASHIGEIRPQTLRLEFDSCFEAGNATVTLRGYPNTTNQEQSSSIESRHILVVDDDPTARELTGLQLRRLGFAVETVETGEAGLQALSRRRYGGALIDYHLPGLSGIEMLQHFRACPDTYPMPCIGVTADSSGDAVRNFAKAHFDDIMLKPLDVEDAVARLESQRTRHCPSLRS